jgi:hypothetical protein
MDEINQRYGDRSIYYAPSMPAQKSVDAAPLRIAFHHIPTLDDSP